MKKEDFISPQKQFNSEIPTNTWDEIDELGLKGVDCLNCDGQGYTVEVEAECCGNSHLSGFDGYPQCCGIPNPVKVQKECKCKTGKLPASIDDLLLKKFLHMAEFPHDKYSERKFDFYIFQKTKKKGMYFFELMNGSEQFEWNRQFFQIKPNSDANNWLMLHEFKTFDEFLQASFPVKTSLLGHGYWFEVSVKYNVEFPVPDEFNSDKK